MDFTATKKAKLTTFYGTPANVYDMVQYFNTDRGVLIMLIPHLPVGITDKDHLVEQFTISRCLGPDLPKDEQQFLQSMIV